MTDAFFEAIELLLSKKISLVAEAAFQHKAWEALTEKVKDSCNISIIICTIEDNLAAKRHLERGLENPDREYYHGDARVGHYRKTGEMLGPAEYISPTLPYLTIEVSTKEAYKPSLAAIKKKITQD